MPPGNFLYRYVAVRAAFDASQGLQTITGVVRRFLFLMERLLCVWRTSHDEDPLVTDISRPLKVRCGETLELFGHAGFATPDTT
jgi:hypothetical protein